MFQWYEVFGTTFRWHMLRIVDGELEYSFQTRLAHAMAAF
jgi:hypothetical protein